MASLMLYDGIRRADVRILLTIYQDAVKLEEDDCGAKRIVGWFRDEVAAISAAVERSLFHSAILSSLRQLPDTTISTRYIDEFSHCQPIEFRPGVRVKWDQRGRRVVRVPGTFGRAWL